MHWNIPLLDKRTQEDQLPLQTSPLKYMPNHQWGVHPARKILAMSVVWHEPTTSLIVCWDSVCTMSYHNDDTDDWMSTGSSSVILLQHEIRILFSLDTFKNTCCCATVWCVDRENHSYDVAEVISAPVRDRQFLFTCCLNVTSTQHWKHMHAQSASMSVSEIKL